ncbi:MAG TPA: discoidin domain-containing protein, partial [Thermoleophilaceae bacterium]
MGRGFGRMLVVVVAMMVGVLSGSTAAQAGEAGKVRFVKEAKAEFDPYANAPSAAQAAWMRAHFWRQKTYAPYFDARTSWYPNAWTYKDLYAIYADGRGEVKPDQHDDWILKDAQGRRLYIPYNCQNGSCSQFAGDIGNPAFRAQWITIALQTLSHGYKGLFVDDVNMEFRVGDGQGQEVAPIDPRTGTTMTFGDWRRYTAEFAEEITAAVKAANPAIEVAHNPIWFSGHTDPYVRRELLAADTINLERGINDDKQPGSGRYAFSTFMQYIDWLHQHGKGVVLDSYTDTQDGAEYNLAAYFLIATERDGLRTDYRHMPDNWWSAYDVDLGDPKGPRYTTADGLVRRDFANGYALVNPPGQPARALTLPAGAQAADGTPRTSLTLPPASGRLVLTPGANPTQPPVHSASAVPPTSEDKAEGRLASASSRESAERGAENAVDGDSGSRWSSAYREGEWWQVDLGSPRAVSSVEIEWENAYAASFRVLTSDDGQDFDVAATAEATGAGRQVVGFSARHARYVRIQSVQRGTQYGISFWEVEVHGPEDGTDPGPGSAEPGPGGSPADPGGSDPDPGGSDAPDAAAGTDDEFTPPARVGPGKGFVAGSPTPTGTTSLMTGSGSPRGVLSLV